MITVTMQEWTVLTFLRNYWRQHGYSPSRREIVRSCGYATTSTLNLHLRQMAAMGVILLGDKPRSKRTVTLCKVSVAVQP